MYFFSQSGDRLEGHENLVLVCMKKKTQSRQSVADPARLYWPEQKHTQDRDTRKGLALKQQQESQAGLLWLTGKSEGRGLGVRSWG